MKKNMILELFRITMHNKSYIKIYNFNFKLNIIKIIQNKKYAVSCCGFVNCAIYIIEEAQTIFPAG